MTVDTAVPPSTAAIAQRKQGAGQKFLPHTLETTLELNWHLSRLCVCVCVRSGGLVRSGGAAGWCNPEVMLRHVFSISWHTLEPLAV